MYIFAKYETEHKIGTSLSHYKYACELFTLPFACTWIHPCYLVGSVLLIFLGFEHVLCLFLSNVLCPNVASVSELSIIDFTFNIL